MKRKGIKGILALIGIVVVTFLLVVSMRTYWEQPDSLESETDYLWVDFDVIGTIQVEVDDTNEGEVPDEAREEARSLLSKCDELKDIDFETVGHTLITSENNLSKTTNTDANKYIVIVSGIIAGDNAEEAKEHFWESICSGVSGNWHISEIDL